MPSHLACPLSALFVLAVSGFEIEESAYCPPDFCQNGGTCYTPKGRNQPFCQCESGFWGARCQHKIGSRPCSKHRCLNGAICDSDGFTQHGGETLPYACRCVGTFTGRFCDETKELVMCKHQKRCNVREQLVVEGGQCKCICKPDYYGENCKQEHPCAKIQCQHGAKCNNENGKCDCTGTFYTGIKCDTIAVNKLPAGTEGYCQGERKLDCQHGSHCTIGNLSGTPHEYCDCPPEWNGDRLCTKAYDPCELTAFERDCKKHPKECGMEVEINDKRCLNGGTCSKDKNSFKCECVKGYLGLICETKDPCQAKSPCRTAKHICRVISSADGSGIQKHCVCNGSFTGVYCQRKVRTRMLKQICEKNKCKNNSTCIPCLKVPGICKTKEEEKRKYICACDLHHSGEFCEHSLDPCKFHTCRNKAKCVKVNDYTYKCVCRPGVEGLHCQIILDICELRSPCEVGECILEKNSSYGYYCQCPPERRGFQCELPGFGFFDLFYMSRNTYVALWTGICSAGVAVVLQVMNMFSGTKAPQKPRKAGPRAPRGHRHSEEADESQKLLSDESK